MKTIRNKHLWSSLLVGLVVAGGVMASNVTLPHAFQPNSPARASEVNANFNAVKSSVDDNHGRLSTVETSVATLQTANGQNWKRGGNTGTSMATDYIGTADNQGLELRVNTSRAVQILPTASAPNVVVGGSECPASLTAGVKGVFVGGGNAIGTYADCVGVAAERHRAYDNNVALVGGYGNAAGSNDATVTNAEYASVLGGTFNEARGRAAAVIGGEGNVASGSHSAAMAGSYNQAGGISAIAMGVRANAAHNNSLVWSDGSVTTFASGAINQFAINAAGGVYFGRGVTAVATVPSGAFIATSTGATLSTGGAWTNASDVALKKNLAPVKGQEVLEAVKSLPVYTWNYKSEGDGVRHIGPTAQDFAARFSLGQDDKHIATVDADGVALAAIKGLAQVVEEQRAVIEAQRKQLAGLEARLSAIEKH
ncbi:MAG: tail fiber domain-containing protein [Myxococcales bacterium]|nr:tail fiber domain-containing protein [Myxococcales bacterium]